MRTGLAPLAATFCLLAHPAIALQITGYNSAVNDRFASGYAGAPVANTSPLYAAKDYDLSGVGWIGGAERRSYAMLSPRHYLGTVHNTPYPGSLTFQKADGSLITIANQSTQATGYGADNAGTPDMSLGTLVAPLPESSGVTSYAIYDGPLTNGLGVLMYGHGGQTNPLKSPRVAAATLVTPPVPPYSPSVVNTSVATSRSVAQVELWDSSSPLFVRWTDPNGNPQLALLGNNFAYGGDYNFHNYIGQPGSIAAINNLMEDEGYALRFVAPVDTTWTSTGSTSLATGANWTSGGPGATRYLGFATGSSAVLTPGLGGGTVAARGLVFSAGSAGFHFTNGTFELDRGGIHNYDTHAQRFDTDFRLTESQYWDGEAGGFIINGDVDNNGHLLVIQGSAVTELNGSYSGSGGLAKDGSGILVLSEANTHTGTTFLHNGTLVANNATGSATGSGLLQVEAGLVAGHGSIANTAYFAAGSRLTAGSVVSGTTPTLSPVLQSENQLTFGADILFDGKLEFYLGALSESVGFTQIRLEGADAEFVLGINSTFTLDASHFLLGVSDPNSGNSFWNLAHEWTLVELTGTGLIDGIFASENLGVWQQGAFTLVYTGGDGNDLVLVYTPVPEPGTWALLLGGGAIGLLLRRRRA